MTPAAVVEAFRLLVAWDRELVAITWNSISFVGASTLVAALIGIPLGVLIAFRDFPGKRAVVSAAHTLTGLPTVVAGLLVFSFVSRSGPLGFLGLLFTPTAVVIGQAILALPILISLVYSGLTRLDAELPETLVTLGASRLQRTAKIIAEGRIAVASAVLTGFGRVVGEVGTAMMHTRPPPGLPAGAPQTRSAGGCRARAASGVRLRAAPPRCRASG